MLRSGRSPNQSFLGQNSYLYCMSVSRQHIYKTFFPRRICHFAKMLVGLNDLVLFLVIFLVIHSPNSQLILGLTQEWFRELFFSRLECGIHDPLCGIFYFTWPRHQIEGRPTASSVSSERHLQVLQAIYMW